MQIEEPLVGMNFCLRSVNMQDGPDILSLRINPEISRYLNPTTDDQHYNWLTEQLVRKGDYYFAIENRTSKKVNGYIGLYGIREKSAEWGRWIVVNNPAATFESILLVLDFGFSLGLKEIYCRTNMLNSKVVALHKSRPYSKSARLTEVDGPVFIRHTVDTIHWPKFRQSLTGMIKPRK